ncbi:hypothetical protein GGP41_006612 [Bipolaris sorokiniana]|uniref:Uncharacterized protein n=1 Tax=Cochliobolus sativus TaxID=45130 RepID=A0A8H5ZNA2_COCSA|nr:hypothetical protein GGP41_006612 [Bipolaris sorokiniana]
MFKATRALSMQPTRMMAMQPSRMMAMQTTRMMAMRQSPQLFVRQTMALRSPVPKEEHSASPPAQEHPHGDLASYVAIVMAFFSIFRKLWVDKTLRLKRQGKQE